MEPVRSKPYCKVGAVNKGGRGMNKGEVNKGGMIKWGGGVKKRGSK